MSEKNESRTQAIRGYVDGKIVINPNQEQRHVSDMLTTVVATGGVARFVVPLCRHEIALERDLQLKGLDLLYRKNRPRKEAAPDPR